jgi:putative hemolysin
MDILILAVLFLLNGLFAMSEIAILSARKIRLRQAADEGVSGAEAALALANEPSHFLSTIQVGITLIGILSGALGEAALSERVDEYLRQFPVIAAYSDALSMVLVVFFITYFSLIIGELVPKRLALLRAEAIAMGVARPMRVLSFLAYPLVRLLSWSTDFVLFILRVRKRKEALVSEREISLMIDEGTEAGLFHKSEKEMVSNVMRLDALKVGAIMTPRMDIDYIDIASPPEEIRKRLIEITHSIIPVCRNGLDNVLGVVAAKDLMRRVLLGKELRVSAAIRQVKYIPKSLSSVQLLEELRRSKISLALVVDEYGEIAGLATLKDVLEAIVGDMPSEELWEEEPEAVQREDGSWLLDGMLTFEKFKQLLSLSELPEVEEGSFNTIGGFVMQHLGRIPRSADHFECGGYHFEVVDMDRNRVDKVLVSKLDASVATSLGASR